MALIPEQWRVTVTATVLGFTKANWRIDRPELMRF